LIAQAAISLENARLYQQLENHAETLERKVEERTQALQQEISDRKHAEAVLLESEQLLSLFFSQSLDGFFVLMLDQPVQWHDGVDKDQVLDYVFEHLRITKTNDAMLAQYRASREQFIGITLNEAFAHDIAHGKDVWRQLFDAGKLYIETDERRLDGTAMWVEGYYICLYDSQGRLIGQFGVQRDVSDRKQVEEALRKSEANYRNLVKTANSIINRFDTQGRIRYINDYGLKFFGYEEHEILGRTLLETIIPEIDSCGGDLKPFVHDLLHNPQSYLQTENENRCRDGRRVWVAWSNQAILDEQGQLVEILSVGNDITQRKYAEAALQRSETKFRNIFENSQVGIFRSRLSDGLILDANQRLADLFGYDSPEDVIEIEHSTDVYVNPGDREYVVGFLTQHGELQNFEVQLKKRDGTVFWALYSARSDTTNGYAEGVVADISDRKFTEAALQASEAELQLLFAAIPDSLCVLTAEGQFIKKVDPDQLIQPIEDRVGKTLHQIFEKEQADEFMGYIQQVLRTQQILTVEYNLWIAGRQIWFSARIAPIQHERVIWLSRDITPLKQAEAASILEERNRMAREIHDTLAQAFTGILIQVGAATQVLEDDPEATQAHLDTIEELARLGLTEARRSVTALRPQLLEEGDLSRAIDRLVTQMRSATDATLIYEIQGDVAPLSCEVENNLLRIGQEALTNAIKYAHASEIRIELVYNDTQCALRVQDNGQGFTVVSAPSMSGFGLLGMSERAERIGAQLRIESQPGQGTEIIVIVDREGKS
jgi:two-component system, NarL family, sensor kinase